jgi:amino acid permease
MIDLKYIVKTSLMPLLKRIISIFLILIITAGVVVLFFKGSNFIFVLLLSVFLFIYFFISYFISYDKKANNRDLRAEQQVFKK